MLHNLYLTYRAPGIILRKLTRVYQTQVANLLFQKVGKSSQLRWPQNFNHPEDITIGDFCLIWDHVSMTSELVDGKLAIGNRVQVNQGCHLDFTGGLSIEDDVLISEEAVLYTHCHGHDPHSQPRAFPKKVGAGAWIGMRAVILPGCHSIGSNSIIGAGAIVTRDVPINSIVAGNPAKVVGKVNS